MGPEQHSEQHAHSPPMGPTHRVSHDIEATIRRLLPPRFIPGFDRFINELSRVEEGRFTDNELDLLSEHYATFLRNSNPKVTAAQIEQEISDLRQSNVSIVYFWGLELEDQFLMEEFPHQKHARWFEVEPAEEDSL